MPSLELRPRAVRAARGGSPRTPRRDARAASRRSSRPYPRRRPGSRGRRSAAIPRPRQTARRLRVGDLSTSGREPLKRPAMPGRSARSPRIVAAPPERSRWNRDASALSSRRVSGADEPVRRRQVLTERIVRRTPRHFFRAHRGKRTERDDVLDLRLARLGAPVVPRLMERSGHGGRPEGVVPWQTSNPFPITTAA